MDIIMSIIMFIGSLVVGAVGVWAMVDDWKDIDSILDDMEENEAENDI